jgi:hypothetical protein
MRINSVDKQVISTDLVRLNTSSSVSNVSKTEAMILLDWVRGGMNIPVDLVTQALCITGDISPLALR